MKLCLPVLTIATATTAVALLPKQSSALTIPNGMKPSSTVTTTATATTYQSTSVQVARNCDLELSDRILTSSSSLAFMKKSPSSCGLIPSANRLKRSFLSVSASPHDTTVPSQMPVLGADGMYELNSPEEHAALLEYASDKLVVLKVYAPWCRACKGLAPKFLQFVNDPKYNDNIPIVWASLSIQHSKTFVKSLGVLALPTVQFYVGGKLVETFGCGPSKVPMLKRKLATLINDYVDPKTRQLKQSSIDEAVDLAELAANRVKEEAAARAAATAPTSSIDSNLRQQSQVHDQAGVASSQLISDEERKLLLNIPYMKEMSLADFDHILEKTRILTFEPGHIIVRQGRPGRLFYVIKSGEVEIMQQTGVEDPLISTGYLGTVINRLGPGDYFGERSLITGEPRAATVRATEQITILAFDTDDFPESSILSGRSKGLAKASDVLTTINDKYGVDVITQSLESITKQLRESSYANQVRGSINNPYRIRGVDDDSVSQESASDVQADIISFDDDDDETDDVPYEVTIGEYGMPTISDNNAIFALLTKFQAIKHVKTCFEYIESSRARWGDDGIRKRRSLLVQRLSPAQAAEFTSTFNLIDANKDGRIELLELKRVIDSISSIDNDTNNQSSDDEFLGKVMSLGPRINGSPYPFITYEDYMGLMAEAEFYQLFRNIFSSLDPDNTGYVKAYELDRVLCGVRDLISDDRKSVIDIEDQDMSIDYEQFARMLLGTIL